jgi:hypothetical protein
VADRCLNGRQYLEQDEGDPNEAEGAAQAFAALNGANEQTHPNGEKRGQNAMKQNDCPPREGKASIGRWKYREEHPLLAFTKALDYSHLAIPDVLRVCHRDRDPPDPPLKARGFQLGTICRKPHRIRWNLFEGSSVSSLCQSA